jgi:ATP-dependent exoDNAse (exonuclease V) beta subunit
MSVIIPKDSKAMKLIKKHRGNMEKIAKLMKPIIINYVEFEKECYEKHDDRNINKAKFDYSDLDDIVHEMLNHDFYYAIQEIREEIEKRGQA